MSGALRRGQFAYAAYGASTGGKTFDGRDMPTWDNLGPASQRAWIAAGNAAAASGPDVITEFLCKHCRRDFPTQQDRIEHKLDVSLHNQEKIMSAQDDINAAVAAIQAVTTDLGAAVANIQAEIAALSSQGVDTSGLVAAVAQLQGVQASVDALETPAAPPADGGDGSAPAE